MTKWILKMLIFITILSSAKFLFPVNVYCMCDSLTRWMEAPFGGKYYLDCKTCIEDEYLSIKCTKNLQNASFYPGLIGTGKVFTSIQCSNQEKYMKCSLIVQGGPVRLKEGKNIHKIYYNNLSIQILTNETQSKITEIRGGMTVDGKYISADSDSFSKFKKYFNYFFNEDNNILGGVK